LTIARLEIDTGKSLAAAGNAAAYP